MKILFVVNTYYPDVNGGAPRSVQMIAEALVADGNEVVIVRLSANKEVETYIYEGVLVYSLPIRNLYLPSEEYTPSKWKRAVWHLFDIFNPVAAFDFWKIMKKERPDVVNTNTVTGFSTSIFYVVKLMGVKLVHTMRDYYLMCPQSGMYKNGKNCEGICNSCKPFSIARKHAAKQVDMFLGNSQFVVDHHRVEKMISDEKLCYNQWNTNGDDIIAESRSIQNAGHIQFGFIGRLNELKGVDVLIKACSQVETNNWSLKIAGTGEAGFIEGLKVMSPTGKVKFLDWVSPTDFYSQIDVLICPSTYHDPLPRVVYEAYKYGIPVLAAATGGTPEMVDHDGTGYLYDAQDVTALAKLMDESCLMSVEDYERLSSNALEKAKLFTKTNILSSYKSRISEVIKP